MRAICRLIVAVLAVLGAPGPAQARVDLLHIFFGSGGDGDEPAAGIVADTHGNLFGTTYNGGSSPCAGVGCGTIFEVSPLEGGWSTNVIYSFQGGSGGEHPQSPVTRGRSGALYGSVGSDDDALVYALAPPRSGGGWTFSTLALVKSATDGIMNLDAPLLLHGKALYGLTGSGGSGTGCGPSGCGTLFKLVPRRDGGTPWRFSPLFSFPGGDGGSAPGWIASDPGLSAIYATTSDGNGAVVSLTPAPHGGQWTETVLYRFLGGKDGQAPISLLIGADGTVYGTARGGPRFGIFGAGGIVFALAPPRSPGSAWTKTTLYAFRNWPPISLTAAPGGALVGVVFGELDAGAGTVFQLAPPPPGAPARWTYTKLTGFERSGSRNPENVVFGKGNHLYGALNGGDSGVGAVFKLK